MQPDDFCSGIAADLKAGNDEKRQNAVGSAAQRTTDAANDDNHNDLQKKNFNSSGAFVVAIKLMPAMGTQRVILHEHAKSLVVGSLEAFLEKFAVQMIRVSLIRKDVVKPEVDCYHRRAFLGQDET